MSETEQLLKALAQRNQNLGNMINAALIAHQDNTGMLQRLADIMLKEEEKAEEDEE